MDNKYVIITGATGGIGSQIAKKCMENKLLAGGCLIYKDQTKFNHIFDHNFNNLYKTYCFNMEENLPVDINSMISLDKPIDSVVLILTSFTINPIKKIKEQSIEEIERNIRINITSQIKIILGVLGYIKEKNINLSIINIDSGAAYRPIDGWSLYSGSKSYINMYLKSLSLEENLHIVSYDPGVVDTNMQKIIRNQNNDKYDFVETFNGYYENGKLNNPMDIATDIMESYIVNWKAENFTERYNRK
jgi:benzil reductase ((S)-benzoin forming)